jgi:hypothetical protein
MRTLRGLRGLLPKLVGVVAFALRIVVADVAIPVRQGLFQRHRKSVRTPLLSVFTPVRSTPCLLLLRSTYIT